ncbi:MAG TPA: hypothetical protein ENH85_00890 [Candidatus Scalindua sp.]|nr:hypothetical protein [Candidatus Scalindua sp.]
MTNPYGKDVYVVTAKCELGGDLVLETLIKDAALKTAEERRVLRIDSNVPFSNCHIAKLDFDYEKTDKKEEALYRLLNEIDCRIQHGAESNGHLEYVHGWLTGILDPNGFEDEKEIKPSMGVKPGQTITIGF